MLQARILVIGWLLGVLLFGTLTLLGRVNLWAQANVAAPQAVDLTITKSAVPDPVVAGEPLTYTIIIRNTGSSTAQRIVIKDTLPSGVNFSGTTTIATLNGPVGALLITSNMLTGTVNSLKSGGLITITGHTFVDTAATGTFLQNSANVVATNEATGSNNTATVNTALITSTPTPTPTSTATATPTSTPTPTNADLQISKSSSPNPVAAGQPLTFTIVVRNLGPATAQNVLIHDTLPAGINFNGKSNIIVYNGIGPALFLTSKALTATVNLLYAGGVITVTGRTLVSINATGSTLINNASVTTSTDANPANNQAAVTTNLLAATTTATTTPTPTSTGTPDPSQADLRISKKGSTTTIQPGQLLTYTIVVNNIGLAPAQNVVIKDKLPAGLNFNGSARISVENGLSPALTINSTMLTGTLPTLNVGGTITVTARTLVSKNVPGSAIVNSASVSANNEKLISNNTGSVTTNLSLTPLPDPSHHVYLPVTLR